MKKKKGKMEFSLNDIKSQFSNLLNSFLEEFPQEHGSIFVIGCSSSEINGGKIGKNSSEEIGKVIFQVANEILSSKNKLKKIIINGLFTSFYYCRLSEQNRSGL